MKTRKMVETVIIWIIMIAVIIYVKVDSKEVYKFNSSFCNANGNTISSTEAIRFNDCFYHTDVYQFNNLTRYGITVFTKEEGFISIESGTTIIHGTPLTFFIEKPNAYVDSMYNGRLEVTSKSGNIGCYNIIGDSYGVDEISFKKL